MLVGIGRTRIPDFTLSLLLPMLSVNQGSTFSNVLVSERSSSINACVFSNRFIDEAVVMVEKQRINMVRSKLLFGEPQAVLSIEAKS
mmetsp:Transcript_534/g.1108  ORF Transcript_534/g.1108 Transcript_534/m.1108 type:complete len:87 (-) Transcript_534:97-357(-)